MRKFSILFSLLGGLLLLTPELFAQNLTISGGSGHSVMICGRGRVYAWGANYTPRPTGATGPANVGLLGLTAGSGEQTSVVVGVPTEVDIPGGLTFNQVDAGSGSATIGLACNGVVYAWGINTNGEVGQGPGGDWAYDTPLPVVQGATPTVAGFAGQLAGVIKVAGSTNASFAIMNDNRLVAWGSNAAGQLGNPAAGNGIWAEPIYVQTTGGDLEDVIDVDAGDSQGYALVDDDGDGIGTVYSWGRIANFASALGRPTADNDIALPVLKEDGTQLDSIVQISAGDQAGFAVDVNGNVWGWGEHSWGCQTGTIVPGDPFSENVDNARAAKVVTGEQNDPTGYLTGVVKVTGGRASIYALLDDNTVVAWGDNSTTWNNAANSSCTNSAFDAGGGGTLGNGQDDGALSRSCEPVFVRYDATTIVNDAVDISDGDTWAFLINQAGEYYAWGTNHGGVLGLNECDTDGSLIYYYPQEMTPNIPCELPDLCPSVNVPSSLRICPGTTFDLSAGFTALAGSESLYSYTWEQGETASGPWTVLSETSSTLTVSEEGFYRVTVSYSGANVGCGCEDAQGVAEVSYLLPDFGAPTDSLFYCQTSTVSSYVETSNPTGIYAWFETSASSDTLAKTVGEGTANIDISGFVVDADTSVRLWVSDATIFEGVVFESNESCDPTFNKQDGNGSQNTNLSDQAGSAPEFQTRFEAYSDLTLTSVDLKLFTIMYSAGTFSGDVNIGVYGSFTDGNGNVVVDQGNQLGTYTIPFSETYPTGASGRVDTEIPITLDLGNLAISGTPTGTAFFITTEQPALTNLVGNGNVHIGIADCQQDVSNIVDNLTGDYLHMTGMAGQWTNNKDAANTKGGHFYNLRFGKGSDYVCGRIPVDIFEKCPPCTTPTSLTVENDGVTVGNGGSIEICDGGDLSLDLTAVWPIPESGSLNKDFEFYVVDDTEVEVYATSPLIDGDGITGGSDTWSETGVDTSFSGTYTIGIRNTNACTFEQTVIIDVISPLAPTPDNFDDMCEEVPNGNSTAVSATTNNGGTLTWYDARTGGSEISGTALVPTTVAAGTQTFYVSETINGCESPRDSVVVTVNPKPAAPTIDADFDFCLDETTSATLTDNVTASPTATLTWYTTGTTTEISQPAIETDAVVNITYDVTQTLLDCESDPASITVVVNDLPNVGVTSDATDDSVCVGVSTDLTPSGANTYVWEDLSTDDPRTVTPATSTTYTVTGTNTTTTCTNTAEITIGVQELPVAAISGGEAICDDGTAEATIAVAFTAGEGPFTFEYAGSTTLGSGPITTSDNPYEFTTMVNETFTVTSLVDNNGCVGTDLGTNTEVSYVAEVTAAQDDLFCPGGATAPFEFQVDLTASGGSAPYLVTVLNSADNSPITDATISGLASGDISVGGIDEAITIDIVVTDGNGCNPDTLKNLNQVCSCPEAISIVAVGGLVEICEEGTPSTTSLQLTFDDGGNSVTDWSFVLEDGDGNPVPGQDYTGTRYNGSDPLVVTGVTAGEYTVTNVNGTCPGSGDAIEITNLPSPAGSISGTTTICDNDVDEATITVTATAGVAPFDFFITGDQSGNSDVLGADPVPATFTTDVDETFTLTGITDANGCTAMAGDFESTATIDYFDDPSVVSIDYDCPFGQDEPHEYSVFIAMTGGQGAGNYTAEAFLAGTTTPAGVTFTDDAGVLTATGIDEDIRLDVVVTDGNGCNPITNLDLGQTCSCPTSASISLVDAEICADASTTLNVGTTGGTGPYDIVITGPNGVINEPAYAGPFPLPITVSDSGLYTITTFYDNGETCNASTGSSQLLTVNALPSGELTATGAANVCDGASTDPFQIEFEGEGPFVYNYTIDGVPQNPGPAAVSPVIIPATTVASTYILTDVEDDNCVGSPVGDPIEVTVEQRPVITLDLTGDDEICLNDATPTVAINVVSGEGPFNGTYELDGVEFPFDDESTTVIPLTTPNAEGTYPYVVTFFEDDNCPVLTADLPGTVSYSVNPLPTVSITGGSTICNDGVTTIELTVAFGAQGTQPFTFDYTEGSLTAASRVSLGFTLPIETMEGGTHTVSNVVDDKGCVALDESSTNVVLKDTLNPSILEPDGRFCEGRGDYTLTPVDVDGGAVTWFKDGIALDVDDPSSLFLNSATDAGSYTVQVDDGFCDPVYSTSDITIVDVDIPLGNPEFNEDRPSVFVGESTELIGSTLGEPDSVRWTSDDGAETFLSPFTELLTVASPTNPNLEGEFDIALTVYRGTCVDAAVLELVVRVPVDIPNTFTPNDDQINDNWEIQGISTYSDAIVRIYNRWGSLVYENFGGYTTPWDGKRNGKELPPATYYYVIDLGVEDINGQFHQGDVTIIK